MDLLTNSIAKLSTVKNVTFGVLSPEQIRALSVVPEGIRHGETYENGRPKIGGLCDPRLGCIDRDHRCATCLGNMTNCQGHYGHIELTTPVYHIGFIKEVKKILEMVCWKCSRLRLEPVDPNDSKDSVAQKYRRLCAKKDPRARFKFAWEHSKNRNVCNIESCGYQSPTIRKKDTRLVFVPKKGEKTKLNGPIKAEDVREVLSKISDADCKRIGLNPRLARPEWLIITVLPVPPMCVRPSVTMDNSGRGDDDLTFKLSEIIKYNNLVNKYKNDPMSRSLPDYLEQLQYHVTTYIDNDVSGIEKSTQKGGRPLKAITARLKGKEGRLRGNLMGKRVNFAARTVITGDPNLSIQEVGVPVAICMNLTYPERVTPYNLEAMRQAVANGPKKHPGARYLLKAKGIRQDLKIAKNASVEVGDTVERHLRDGDIVVFNRQPSLHKMSMMGHKVRVMPFSTFRMNLTPTAPYNADFDGDEMNLHVPQSEITRAEISELTVVPKMIVSPQANKPVMGIVQDALLGCHLFTQRDQFFDKEFLMNILLWIPQWDGHVPEPSILKPQPLWTGKQIFSLLIPKGTFVHTFHSSHPDEDQTMVEQNGKVYKMGSPGDTRVIIHDGELLSGIVCKRTVGASRGGLIHVLWNDHGPFAASDFLDGCQFLMSYYLTHRSFSVGIADAIITNETESSINAVVKAQDDKVQGVLNRAYDGDFPAQGNMSVEETLENAIMDHLSKARDGAGKVAQRNLNKFNNIRSMVQAGSKGSNINIAQISACVGQQNVEGKRIPFGFKNRSLPHFTRDDFGPASRGFVYNSYIKGLQPYELFFHAMGGREGLIDTAVKTAEVGYFQRRLIKAMEDLSVQSDGTVRNSRGDIVQLFYGEDGMDATCIEHQVFPTMLLNDADFERRNNNPDVPEEFQLLTEERAYLRKLFENYNTNQWAMPLNVSRILNSIRYKSCTQEETPLNARYVFEEIQRLRQTLVPRHTPESTAPSHLFGILIQSVLASKPLLKLRGPSLSKERFDEILQTIHDRYFKGLVHSGEMVGTVAAQSIGEPATQMTLNTFHFSGINNVVVTTGIPRLKELINAAKHLKTPSMTVYLDESSRFDKRQAEKIRASIQHTTFKDLLEEVSILYDPDYRNTVVVEDREWLGILLDVPDDYEDLPDPNVLPPFVIRMTLSRKELYIRDLSMERVANVIQSAFGSDLFILRSDDNDSELVLLLRTFSPDKVSESGESGDEPGTNAEEKSVISPETFYTSIIQSLLDHVTVCGVPGIDKAFVSEKKVHYYDESGSLKTKDEYVILTDGINMEDTFMVPGIDPTRLYCNNPQKMMDIFGVEVAKASLLQEIRDVIQSDGSYVNFRHIALLCEVMTQKGGIMSITRHGINRTDAGPLMKCTFEQTVDILRDAAINGERDELAGVAENILMGKIAPLGTGSSFGLRLDLQALNDVEDVDVRSDKLYTSRLVEKKDVLNGTWSSSSTSAPQPRALTYNPLKPSYKTTSV